MSLKSTIFATAIVWNDNMTQISNLTDTQVLIDVNEAWEDPER